MPEKAACRILAHHIQSLLLLSLFGYGDKRILQINTAEFTADT